METIRIIAQILLALAGIVIAIVGAILSPNIVYKLRQLDPKERQAGGRPPKEQPKILWKILWISIVVALLYPVFDFGLNKFSTAEMANQLASDANKQAEEANRIALKSISADVSIKATQPAYILGIFKCKLPESNLSVTSFNVNNEISVSNNGGAPTSIEKIEIFYKVNKDTYEQIPTIFRLSNLLDDKNHIALPIYLPPGVVMNIKLDVQSQAPSSPIPAESSLRLNSEFDKLILKFYLIDGKTIELNQNFIGLELEGPKTECWSQ